MNKRAAVKVAVAIAGLLVSIPIAASHRIRTATIRGPHESQVCDVGELHVAASKFESASAAGEWTERDFERLKQAVSACVFISGERELDIAGEGYKPVGLRRIPGAPR